MTTQETIDDLVARFRQALEQREITAREWERQCQQMSESLRRERETSDTLRVDRRALCDILSASSVTTAGQTLADAMQSIIVRADALERQLGEAREGLAAYAHEAWSGWKKYEFSKGVLNADGTWTCPAWAVERWTRQMRTAYADLPEEEKLSDRAEADRMLAIMRGER